MGNKEILVQGETKVYKDLKEMGVFRVLREIKEYKVQREI